MNKKLNVIFLINIPAANESFNVHQAAYQKLETILLESYSECYNIILIRYSYSVSEEKRSLKLLIVTKSEEVSYLEEILDFGNLKFTEANFLGLLFSYIKSVYKSNNTILFIWGHGYGVGVFKDFNKFLNLQQDNKMLALNFRTPFSSPFLINKPTNKPDLNKPDDILALDDEDISDMLSTSELNGALKIGFLNTIGGKKIDLLVFINCDMMRFDNIYDLSLSANYIVGPETPISWWGYDYKAFLKYINDNYQTHGENFWEGACVNLTTNITNVTADENYKDSLLLNKIVVSAVACNNAEELHIQLNKFLLSLISDKKNIDTWTSLFNKNQNGEGGFTDEEDTSNSWAYDDGFIKFESAKFDLRNFDLLAMFQKFEKELSENSVIKNECTEIIKKLRSLIFSKSNTGANPNFSGISITFPRSTDELMLHPFFHGYMMPGSKNSDVFAYESYWPEFVGVVNKYVEQQEG